MATGAIAFDRVHKDFQTIVFCRGELDAARDVIVVARTEGLKPGGRFKRGQCLAHTGEGKCRIFEDVFAVQIRHDFGVGACGDLGDHTRTIFVVHFIRSQKWLLRLLRQGVGPAIPEQTADRVGITVEHAKAKGRRKAAVGVLHHAAAAKGGGQTA